MDEQNLNKLKLLILQAPETSHLLSGEVDSKGFQKYSQLPAVPDRDQWWEQIRTVSGFLIMTMRDMLIREVKHREAVEDKVRKLEEVLDRILSQEGTEFVKEPEVVQIEAEQVPPPNFVQGSTWDPFEK